MATTQTGPRPLSQHLPAATQALKTARQQRPTSGQSSDGRRLMEQERKCPACLGMGHVLTPNPGGEYYLDGQTRADVVTCPTCGAGRQQDYLRKLCRLSPDMQTWTYANTTATEHNLEAYDYGQIVARQPAYFYTLQGPYGTGKTRLLACLVNAGRAHGWTSVYLTMAELLDHLRRAYAPTVTNLDFDGLWESICNARILAIDECDRFNPTPWAQEKFFELVERRYREGSQRCTAFATNADVDELDGYLASRMHDYRGRLFVIGGGDWRR